MCHFMICFCYSYFQHGYNLCVLRNPCALDSYKKVPTYLLTYLLTCLLAYLLTYLLTYILAYLLTCLLTYVLTYLLTCVRTYLGASGHFVNVSVDGASLSCN